MHHHSTLASSPPRSTPPGNTRVDFASLPSLPRPCVKSAHFAFRRPSCTYFTALVQIYQDPGVIIPEPWGMHHAFHPRLFPAPIDSTWQYSRRFCKPPVAPTPLRQIGAFCVASPFLHLDHGLGADIPRPSRHYPRALGHAFHPCPHPPRSTLPGNPRLDVAILGSLPHPCVKSAHFALHRRSCTYFTSLRQIYQDPGFNTTNP